MAEVWTYLLSPFAGSSVYSVTEYTNPIRRCSLCTGGWWWAHSGRHLKNEHTADPEGKQQAAGDTLQGSLSRVWRVKEVIGPVPRMSGRRTDHSSLRQAFLSLSLTWWDLGRTSSLWSFPEWHETEQKNRMQSNTPSYPVTSSYETSSVPFLTSLLPLLSVACLITSGPWIWLALLSMLLPFSWTYHYCTCLFSLSPSCFLAIHPCFCWHTAKLPPAWYTSHFTVIQPFQLPWAWLYILFTFQ